MSKLETLRGLKPLLAGGKRVRRVDYKGTRRRLNLRVKGELVRDLHLIKFVTGEDQNSYCLRVLSSAVASTIADLKARHDPATWEALLGFAEK